MKPRLSEKERKEQIASLKKQLWELLKEIFEDKQNIYDFLGPDILVTRLDYARKNWRSKEKLIGALTVEICGVGNASLKQCHQQIKEGKSIDINQYPDIHPNIPTWAINKAKATKQLKNEIVVFPYQGNFYLFYFEWKEIKLASFASPWDSQHKTPYRDFRTDFKDQAYISQNFPWPMPRAIYLGEWGFFIHMGKTSGKPLSHWCIRLPWIYAKKLFEMIPSNAKIPVRVYRH